MLLVSPLIAPGSVSHEVYDHTSIIKTILQRFCRSADGALPQMGARVAAASGLGAVLTLAQARATLAVPAAVLAQRAAWEADVRAQDFTPLAPACQPDGEVAAAAAVPFQSDAEAGAIAAHRQLARTARNAQAANNKTAGKTAGATAPKPAGRRRRQGGKTAPAGAVNGGKPVLA